MDWLYIAGGILVLLYGIWLFAEFASDAVIGWLAGRVQHD